MKTTSFALIAMFALLGLTGCNTTPISAEEAKVRNDRIEEKVMRSEKAWGLRAPAGRI